VPDVFISTFKTAKSDRNAQQTLSSPDSRRCQCKFSNSKRFAAEDKQLNGLLDILLEHFFESIIVSIKSNIANANYEVKKGFKTRLVPW